MQILSKRSTGNPLTFSFRESVLLFMMIYTAGTHAIKQSASYQKGWLLPPKPTNLCDNTSESWEWMVGKKKIITTSSLFCYKQEKYPKSMAESAGRQAKEVATSHGQVVPVMESLTVCP